MGEVLDPDTTDFGEGLAHLGGGELLQILWQTGRGYRLSALAGEGGYLRLAPPHFRTPLHDGWGLEFDGKELVVTDGGSELFFIDPKSFEINRRATVTDGGIVVEMANELEYVNG